MSQQQFKPLNTDQEDKESVLDMNNFMIKSSVLLAQAKSVFLRQVIQGISDELHNQGRGRIPYSGSSPWMTDGVICEILKPGKNWRKGKLRFKLSLEFCPDEPEPEDNPESASGNSSLDVIRQG